MSSGRDEGTSQLSPELLRYLAALHDIIAAYHDELCNLMSPRVANAFLARMSDRAMLHLGFDREGKPVENAKALMARLGMKLELVKASEGFDCKIECPFADQVHPLMVSKNPICPIMILVLGAVRVNQRNAVPTKITLLEKGTVGSIRPLKEGS